MRVSLWVCWPDRSSVVDNAGGIEDLSFDSVTTRLTERVSTMEAERAGRELGYAHVDWIDKVDANVFLKGFRARLISLSLEFWEREPDDEAHFAE